MEQKFGQIRVDLNPTYTYKFKVTLPNLQILIEVGQTQGIYPQFGSLA